MICPVCKGENREEYKFCAYCGTPRPVPQTGKETLALSSSPVTEAPPPVVEAIKEASEIHPPKPGSLPVPGGLADQAGASAEVDQLVPPSSDETPPRKKRWQVTCLIIVAILFCLVVGTLVSVALLKPEWLPFEIPFLTNNDRLVIGFADESGATDLYLLRQGKAAEKGLLLAEDVSVANSRLFYQPLDTLISLADSTYAFAAFIPEQEYLVFWYTDEAGKITLKRIDLNQKAPVSLWNGTASSFTGYVLRNPQDLFFSVAQDSREVCYLSSAGTTAEEVLRGDFCSLSTDLSTAYATALDGTKTSLQLVNLADNAKYTPLDTQDNLKDLTISADGARVAYTDMAEANKVIMLDSRNTSTVTTGPEAYAVLEQGFASRNHIGYFIIENIASDLELYLLSDSGATLIHTAQSISAGMDLNGSYLIYMAGEYEGERTLYVRNVSQASDTEVMRGNELRFELATSINRIFITTTQGKMTTIYSAHLDGSELVSLYSCEECQLGKITYVPEQPYVYFELSSGEGLSLMVAHLEQASQFLVVENWASIKLLDTSTDGLQLLYAGADDANADNSLYLVHLDTQEIITLDDDVDGIANSLFNEKNDAVLYTAITGTKPDDVEIRFVQIDLSKPIEVLYSDAFLVAAQWDTLHPLLTTVSPLLLQGTSYCPGASMLEAGATLEGNVDAQVGACYGYRGLAGEKITFWATTQADIDLAIKLYDRRGNLLDSDDTGFNGTDPRLITELPADGIYFLVVTSSNNPGGFTLSSAQGSIYCPGVETLTIGEKLSSEILDNGQQFFSFSGNDNQTLTFWIESTDLDPTLTLYDSEGFILGNDDDSRDGVDPLLITTLPEDGTYCLEVNNLSFETGPFAISLQEDSVFCPGADTIPLDQTVFGSVSGDRRICFAIEVTGGSLYSFIVDSPSNTDTMLELYDSNGFYLDSDDDSGGSLNPLLVFNPEQSGTYYIIIFGYSTESTGEYQLSFLSGYDFCPNAQYIQLDDVISDALVLNQKACYYFEGTASQAIQISVESPIDTTLTLYDENGEQLEFNDDSVGLDPRIRTTLPEDGTFYIALQSFGDDEGEFTLTFGNLPDYTNPFDIALPLPISQRITGEITQEDAIFMEAPEYAGYGDFYYFDGMAGQTIQIDVFADTLGSMLDPWLILFDETGLTVLADNDDSGDTLDAQIVYTLPSNGRYIVMVIDAGGEFGFEGSHFYEILLTYP